MGVNELIHNLQQQDQTTDKRDRIEITVRHSHVPQLTAIDGFDFDSRNEVIVYHGDELIESLLEPVSEPYVTLM